MNVLQIYFALIKLVKLEFKPKAGAQSLPRVHCWCLSGYWERPRIITMLINQIKDVFFLLKVKLWAQSPYL